MKRLLKVVRYFFAVICTLAALIYIVLIFAYKSGIVPLAICAVIFGSLSFLLFRGGKKKESANPLPPNTFINPVTSINDPVSLIPKQPPTTNTAYIIDEDNDQIIRADGKPFDKEDFPFLKEMGIQRAAKNEYLSSNPKFHRTPREKELAFQFSQKHGGKSTKICDVFQDLYHQACETKNIDEKIDLLQKTIDAFELAKQWHYQHSKGAMLWFQDCWECCHNSQAECFNWVDYVYTYREQLIKKRDIIIPWILDAAQKGVLQTEIYKVFPEEEKTDLRRVIKALADNGIINMVKKGNTYFISSNTQDFETPRIN